MIFTPCQSCKNTLVCCDLGNCYIKSPQFKLMMTDTPRTKSFMQSLQGYSSSFEVFCERVEEFASTLERELAQALKEKKEWKASHDNQVKIKNIIATRGDLKDRAPKVEKLVAELNNLKKYVSELEKLFMSSK